jgi:hypothetical protein
MDFENFTMVTNVGPGLTQGKRITLEGQFRTCQLDPNKCHRCLRSLNPS